MYLPVEGPLNSCFLLAFKTICSAALSEQAYEQGGEQRYLVPPTLFPFVFHKVCYSELRVRLTLNAP